MKPKPLTRNKRIASFDAEYCSEGSFWKDKDIESAVAWLKIQHQDLFKLFIEKEITLKEFGTRILQEDNKAFATGKENQSKDDEM